MVAQDSMYHHKIIKVITDNPGLVLHAADIAEQLNLTTRQVSDAIRRYQRRDTDRGEGIGKDIRTIATGHSWQYVPNAKVIRALQATGRTVGSRPSNGFNPLKGGDTSGQLALTAFVRVYFEQNANRIVYLNELVDAANNYYNEPLDVRKVLTGLNNAKSSKATFRDELLTVVAGQAWQYIPRGTRNNAQQVREPAKQRTTPIPDAPPLPAPVPDAPPSIATPATMAATPAPVDAPQSAASTIPDDNLIMLEKLGNDATGNQLVRDVETQQLYRLMPL